VERGLLSILSERGVESGQGRKGASCAVDTFLVCQKVRIVFAREKKMKRERLGKPAFPFCELNQTNMETSLSGFSGLTDMYLKEYHPFNTYTIEITIMGKGRAPLALIGGKEVGVSGGRILFLFSRRAREISSRNRNPGGSTLSSIGAVLCPTVEKRRRVLLVLKRSLFPIH